MEEQKLWSGEEVREGLEDGSVTWRIVERRDLLEGEAKRE